MEGIEAGAGGSTECRIRIPRSRRLIRIANVRFMACVRPDDKKEKGRVNEAMEKKNVPAAYAASDDRKCGCCTDIVI